MDEPQRCSSMANSSECSAAISNQTFFSPETSNLPTGAYVVLGCTSITHFADYLDAHPEVNVTHLLISDSTVLERDTNYGYRTTNFSDDLYDDWIPSRRQKELPLTDEQEDEIEDVRHHNAKLELKLKRRVRDISGTTKRILDRVAPSLQALSYLTYLNQWRRDQLLSLLTRDYPRLSHLTLKQPSSLDTRASDLQSFFLHLPALSHIHLVRSSYNGSPSLASFRQFFPSLTHVRFTAVDSFPTELVPQWVPRTFVERLKDMTWYQTYKQLPM